MAWLGAGAGWVGPMGLIAAMGVPTILPLLRRRT